MRPNAPIRWSACPALLVASAFGVGVLLDRSLVEGSPVLWALLVALGGLLVLGMEAWDRWRLVTLAPLGRVLAAALMGLGAGGACHAVYDAPSPRALAPIAEAVEGTPVSITGRIQGAPERADSTTRFTAVVDSVFGAQDTARVDGQVRVTLRPAPWAPSTGSFPSVYEGDRVRLHGHLQPAPGQRNPGGIDYAAYLSRRGTCCTMYVSDPRHVHRQGTEMGLLTATVVHVRTYIRAQIARYVPGEEGRAVLSALLLGDRSRISAAQRERFAATGLMHLLAVSGLHVFLVGMVLYVLLRPVLMRLRLPWRAVEGGRAALTVSVLVIYMLLTGSRPSVVRAVVMSSLLIGGTLLQRSTHPLNTLGVAVLVLLAVRPPALLDAGFQLSVAAVAGIVVLHPRFMEAVDVPGPRVLRWSVSTVSVSAAAILATAPVLLYHFGRVSVAGLLLNVWAIPCTVLALSSGVALVVFAGTGPTVGAALGSAADLFVDGLLMTTHWGTVWLSWAEIRTVHPGVWGLGALAAGIVAVAQWPWPRLRWRWVLCALALATIDVWEAGMGRSGAPTLDVVFFDVGQGDAALVSSPNDWHMMVDTGPSSSRGSAAHHAVLPYLKQRGIDHLDVVAITHPDADHLGGVPTLVEEVSVGRFVHSGQAVRTDLFSETRRLLEMNEIPHRAVQRGDTLTSGSTVDVEVLGPPSSSGQSGTMDTNERSVVLRVTYGKTSVLLPGDVEENAERNLVRAYGRQLRSQVVNVPHHGSKTSSTPSFVEATVDEKEGTYAVVSAGRSNRFDMPHHGVVQRWESEEATVQTTASEGAVWIRSDGQEVWQVHWK